MNDELARPRFTAIGKKKVRVDATREPESAPNLKTGNLLELFRACLGTAPRERRAMPRHDVARFRVWLGWWKADGTFAAASARLANISRGGALVFLSDPPPQGHPVWVGLGEDEPEQCVPGSVLHVRSSARKECAARLAFREPCPHQFLEAAVILLDAPRAGRV